MNKYALLFALSFFFPQFALAAPIYSGTATYAYSSPVSVDWSVYNRNDSSTSSFGGSIANYLYTYTIHGNSVGVNMVKVLADQITSFGTTGTARSSTGAALAFTNLYDNFSGTTDRLDFYASPTANYAQGGPTTGQSDTVWFRSPNAPAPLASFNYGSSTLPALSMKSDFGTGNWVLSTPVSGAAPMTANGSAAAPSVTPGAPEPKTWLLFALLSMFLLWKQRHSFIPVKQPAFA